MPIENEISQHLETKAEKIKKLLSENLQSEMNLKENIEQPQKL